MNRFTARRVNMNSDKQTDNQPALQPPERLLPCPFCGATPYSFDEPRMYVVIEHSNDCYLKDRLHDSRRIHKTTIPIWNTRAHVDGVVATPDVEAVAKQIVMEWADSFSQVSWFDTYALVIKNLPHELNATELIKRIAASLLPPPACANCGDSDPHNGPAGTVDDACTHEGCNCGYYQSSPQSISIKAAAAEIDRLLSERISASAYLSDAPSIQEIEAIIQKHYEAETSKAEE